MARGEFSEHRGSCSTPGCAVLAVSWGLCKIHYEAAYMGRGSTPGLLGVECWCRRQIVMVSQSDVLNGRTRTCGHARCDAKAAV